MNHTLVLLAQYALVTALHVKHSLSVNFVSFSYSSLSDMVYDLHCSLSLRLYIEFVIWFRLALWWEQMASYLSCSDAC